MSAANKLPTVPVPAVGNGASDDFSLSVTGATFNEEARSVLRSDPAADTIAELNELMTRGHDEWVALQARLASAQAVAKDPLADDAEAEAARSEIATVTITMERVQAAYDLLNAHRLVPAIKRHKDAEEVRIKAAARARHAAVIETIKTKYPGASEEMVNWFTELEIAEADCRRLNVLDIDFSVARSLNIPVKGPVGVVYLPRLDNSLTYWPRPRQRMPSVPYAGPTLADMQAVDRTRRN